jgi:hypothetical protein
VDKANRATRPHFEIDQAVLVDQGLPGAITAVKRGVVLAALGIPRLDTWLYTVEPESGGNKQADIPEYNLVPQPAEQVLSRSARSSDLGFETACHGERVIPATASRP